MKKSAKSMISRFLLVSLILTLFSTAFMAIGVSASTDISAINKVIVDFRSEKAIADTFGEIYHHTPKDNEPDPLTGGKYSFNEKEAATKIEYAESTAQPPLRLMFKATSSTLTAAYKYVAIVYKAVTASPYTLTVSNTPKQGVAITSDGTSDLVNNGWKIVIADASQTDGNGKSLISRWVAKSINTLSFATEDKDAGFYLKEVGFFKTEEDAQAYYKAVDLSIGHENKPLDTTNLPDPVVIPFDGNTWNDGVMGFNDFTDNEEGEYEFVSIDGVNALRLICSPRGSWPYYRTMPYIKEKGLVTADHKYVTVTYMTTATEKAAFLIINNKTASDRVTLVEDTSVSGGKWVTSEPAELSADMVSRYSNKIHCTIAYDGTKVSSKFYIKEIAFFVSEEQAAAYHGKTAEVEQPVETKLPFTDVKEEDSIYGAVKYVVEKGLFNGTSETTFSPNTNMTRSMFVTVLGRLDGADVSKYTAPTFSDVQAGQWYTSYVEWAAANSIVNGIGNGLYGINDNVTVEQACVMLARYAQNSLTPHVSGKTVKDFADAASVSSWATEAVNWAVENRIYAGTDGKLNPTAPASRAVVATMFYNYVNVFAK